MQPRTTNGRRINYFSLLTLIFANGFAIWQFAINDGSILQVLWIYWLQSVIIGVVNVVRILRSPLKLSSTYPKAQYVQHSTDSPKISVFVKYGAAALFTMHYGIFHLVYAVFLAAYGLSKEVIINGSPTSLDLGVVSAGIVLFNGALFLLHHLITLAVERAQLIQNPDQAPGIIDLMVLPYKRIMPMHIIIIVGPFVSLQFNNTALFGIFIALKTLVDLGSFYKGTGHPGKLSAATNYNGQYAGKPPLAV